MNLVVWLSPTLTCLIADKVLNAVELTECFGETHQQVRCIGTDRMLMTGPEAWTVCVITHEPEASGMLLL